jgi:uncharacterized protein YndB with AHSA1/START domain
MNSEPIVVERTLNAPSSRVWKAITDKNEMKRWSFDIPEFKPEVGFEFRFLGGKDDRKYLHICKVTEVVVGKKLTYSWRYDGYEGISYVTFELENLGNQTKLTLTHSGIGTFPSTNPDFAGENFVMGWTWIVGTGIRESVEAKAG